MEKGNYRAVGPIMWQGTAFSFGMAVCLLMLMYFSAAPLIRLLITSDSIYGATYEFFTWRIWGISFFAFVNVMFRGLYIGITRTKVLTMNAVVMALVNVVLDYALVFGELGLPEMGVRGAALASVIAEASSLLFFLLYTYYEVDLQKIRTESFWTVRFKYGATHPSHILFHDGTVFSGHGHLVCHFLWLLNDSDSGNWR